MINKFFDLRFFILGLSLVFWPFWFEKYEFPKFIAFLFSIFFIIGLNYNDMINQARVNVKRNSIYLLLIVFGVLSVFSSVFNNFFMISFWGQPYRYQGIISVFLYIGVVTYWNTYPRNKANDYKIIKLSVTINVLVLTMLYVIDKLELARVDTYNGRYLGFMGNPNFMGAYLCLWLSLLVNKIKTNQISHLMWLMWVGWGIYLTGSRMCLIWWTADLVYMIVASQIATKYKIGVGILITTILVMIVVNISQIRGISLVENRLVIYKKSLIAFSQKPIWGYGVDNFEAGFKASLNDNDFDLKNIRVDKAHNEFLEVLVTRGLVGLAVYVAMIVEMMVIFGKNKQTNLWWGLLGYVVISSTNVININTYIYFYYLVYRAIRIKNSNLTIVK